MATYLWHTSGLCIRTSTVQYIDVSFGLRNGGEILWFTDDTKVLHRDKTWKSLRQKATYDPRILKKWFLLNKLTVNWEETKFLSFFSNMKGQSIFGDLQNQLNT